MVKNLFRNIREGLPVKIKQGLHEFIRHRPTLHSLYTLIKYRYTDYFHVVEVETITACNLRCSYCPNSKYDRGLIKNTKKMKTRVFYKLIDELAELDFRGKFHPHFYGEPLLDERLPVLMAYARKKLPSAKIFVFTNGELLTLELYKKLVEAGINGFLITQHLPTESVNVKNVRIYNKEHDKENIEIRYKKFNPCSDLMSRGGVFKVKKMSYDRKICNRPSTNLVVDYEGNVILCCNDYFSSVKFGNIGRERLVDIWNKPRYKQLRKSLYQDSSILPICQECDIGVLDLGKRQRRNFSLEP